MPHPVTGDCSHWRQELEESARQEWGYPANGCLGLVPGVPFHEAILRVKLGGL